MFSLPFRAMLFLCVSLPLHAFAFHRPGLLFLCCASRTTAHLFRCHALSLIALPLHCPSARFQSTRFLCVASSHPAFPLPLVSIRFHCILRLVLPFRYFSELFRAVPLQIGSYLFFPIALPLLSTRSPCPSDRLGSIALLLFFRISIALPNVAVP